MDRFPGNSYWARTRLRSLTTIVAAAVSFSVFVQSSSALAGDMDAQAKALEKLDADWSKSAVAKDVDRLASFYVEDAFVYPPNSPLALGRAAARKVWASYFSDPSFSISWKTAHASVSKSGEMGFTAGTYEDSYKGGDGKMVSEKGKYVTVWEKQKDGTWKAVHDIWNSDSR
jgi:ketosteroid isomerase-like protein